MNPPKDLKSHYMYWKKDKDSSDDLASLNPMGNNIWKIKDEAWKDISSWSPLIIKNIQQEHFRTFFLKLKLPSANPTFYEYEIRKLTVSVDPSSPVLPGEKVTLSCSAETPRGERIKWMNPRGVRNLLNPFTFSASMRDNGPWSCMVTDVPCSLLPLISWEQIKAKGFRKLHWSFIPTPGSVPQTLFSLSAEGLLTWKPNQNKGLLQPGTNLKKGDLSLGRNRGIKEYAGEYICALEFENGVSLNRSVHVKLLQIVSSTGTELISGQQLNLTCGLEQPLTSDLHLKWFPPKQTTLSDPRPSSLIIPAVSIANAGKWRCELWQNNTKLTSAEITLEIVPWLSVWMLVVICSVTVIIILLFILAFILCRRRQQKMRHLRRRLCKCK
ncbi:hypothetical protein F7725_017981, partial [Dissostichus mawsoni]